MTATKRLALALAISCGGLAHMACSRGAPVTRGPAPAAGSAGSAAAPVPAAAPAPGVERFGPGVFSTDAWDFFVAFSPDQTRALFGRADDAFEYYRILETRRGPGGEWSAPTTPRFADGWSTADPHISPDGSTVYFISNRPDPGETAPRATYDIFSAALGPDGEWGEARRLPPSVNGPVVDKWSPSIAASGALYYGAALPGGRGGSDLWVSRLVDGVYQPPENLGEAINTAGHEVEPWIAPDESYLIFAGLRLPGGAGGYDMYLSRRIDGRWTRAEPIGGGINTAASEWNHSVSPDGKWLYFTRTPPGGRGDIYRVPMEQIMIDPPRNATQIRSLSIAPGGAYSNAFEVAGAARTLYISGQIPVRPDGSVPATFEEQCRQVWANIDRILTDAGMTRRDLVKVTTYLSDRKYRADNSRVRREYLGEHLPALTIIIAGIYDPAWLLEIEAVAAAPAVR